MKRIAVLLVICWATSLLAQELPISSPDQVGMSSKKLAQIGPAMQQFVDKHKLPGVITVVARHGKILHLQAVGMMDIEADKPMQTDAILRFYSMSKPVTTVAAMILYDEGRFELDDPVSKYINEFEGLRVYGKNDDGTPGLTDTTREMTVRDLMRHTSGLTYGFFGNAPVDVMYREANVLGRDGTLADMTAKLGRLPLLFQPGSRWHYSVATDVLGRFVEVVSETPLDQFFQRRIFNPLDMKDTGFSVPPEKLDRFASNYSPKPGGGLRPIDPPAESNFAKPTTFYSGGGGLVSTARDYIRFCQMLLNRGELNGQRLLEAETVKLMTANQLPEELVPIGLGPIRLQGTGFGLGFAVRVEAGPDRRAGSIGEFGWGGAASTNFWIVPREGLIGLALTQHMPLANQYNEVFKRIVYDAIEDPYQSAE